MRIKKRYLTIPAILAAVIAVGWLGAPTAQAHNSVATPSCSGLSWSATQYERTDVNSIVVKVDGVIVHSDPDFKASDTGSVTWSQTAPHAWSVVINAPGTSFDRSYAGTWQACVVVTTTTVAPTTTTVAVTTTSMPISTTSMPIPTTVAPPTTSPSPCDTTVTAGSCFPPVPTPPVTVVDIAVLTPAVEPILPRTGLSVGDLAFAAIIVLLLGVGLVGVRRQRP